jgi:hypothetical protein
MGTLLIVDEDADTREAYGALLTAPDRTVVPQKIPNRPCKPPGRCTPR